ncbi:MAG: RloB family protein [Planctomycetaceae bacterium]|nr:RloB family protein [Planctomycetaceae bacterium]
MSFYKRLKPPVAQREYRQLHVIAVEGDRTEKNYFQYLSDELDFAVAKVQVIPPESRSAPRHVLEKLYDYIKNSGRGGTTFLWMVIDKDQNKPGELDAIFKECRSHKIECCVSNPAFPFWLLLHFENGQGIPPAESDKSNSAVVDCENRIREKRYLPGFDKRITGKHWEALRPKLERAIANAKKLDDPPCKDYPRERCGSTVYRLVEKLLPAISNENPKQET